MVNKGSELVNAAQLRRAATPVGSWRTKRWVIGALMLVTVAVSLWVLNRSSVFSITSIEVVGTVRLADAAVVHASGLHEGGSALLADLDDAEERIRSLQGVSDVQIDRMGSLGVRITVVERIPAIEVRVGGLHWLLDQDGAVVDTAAAPNGRLPIIVMTGHEPIVGMAPPVDAAAVPRLLELWRALRPLRSGVGQLMLDRTRGVSFQLGSVEIRFGGLERIDAKVRAIVSVDRRVRMDGDHLVALDVTAPSRPAAQIAG